MRRTLLAVLAASLAAGACRDDDSVLVHHLTLTGVRSVDAIELKASLATREDSRIPLIGIRTPWSRRRNTFEQPRLDADLRRIEAFYADRGFPDARVANVAVAPNRDKSAVDITVVVEEGQPVILTALDLHGFDVVPRDRVASLESNLRSGVGKPRDRRAVLLAHDLAVNELRDHGYPYARVTTTEDDGPGGKDARIDLTAEPGPIAHFGSIEIAGHRSVGEGIIRRQLLYKPGDLYRRSVVQETQRRLYAMELFQFVNIESLEPEKQAPDLRTRVTVAEGKHQRVNAGVGYGTEEKLRGEGEYHHVNFLGGARSAGAHGRWSSLDRGMRFDFTQPYFLTPKLRFGAEGQRWYTYTPAYESVVTGARVTLTHQFNSRTSLAVSLLSERNNSSISQAVLDDPELYNDLIALGLDPTTGRQEGTIGSVGADFRRSTADNLLDPARGYQFTVHLEDGGGVLPGTFNYTQTSADARHYLPLGRKFVAASRVQLGSIRAKGGNPANVPFARKYFLGGASSVRGWGRYEISPLGGSGLPIGGNAMFAVSSELRATLRGKLGGVLFADAGEVWADQQSVDVGTLKYALGAGFRYRTPVGPIRLDFGYQVNSIEGLKVNGGAQARRWRLHFSIGQAF